MQISDGRHDAISLFGMHTVVIIKNKRTFTRISDTIEINVMW